MTNKALINFNNQGFTILRNVISKSDVKKVLEELEIVKKLVIKQDNKKYFHKTKDGKFNTIHDIQNFYLKGYLVKLTKNKKLTNFVKKILSKNIKLRNLEFFLKPAKTGMQSPFHQDNYYWNIKKAKAVNSWIALSKTSAKNGGVCYLSGSHKIGTIDHEMSYMKGSSQKIPNSIIKKLKFKKFFPKLNTGDCVIHHPEVIHGSNKNNSKFERMGVVISYIDKNAKLDLKKLNLYKKKLKKSLKKLYN